MWVRRRLGIDAIDVTDTASAAVIREAVTHAAVMITMVDNVAVYVTTMMILFYS